MKHGTRSTIYFNDHVAKRKRDVLRAYDKAIALAEGTS